MNSFGYINLVNERANGICVWLLVWRPGKGLIMILQRGSGRLLMGTALVHMLLGIVLFWQPVRNIVMSGVINGITPHYDRGMVFWFLFFGVLLWILGQTTQWMETKYNDLPRSLGWGLLGLAVVGILFIPISGFWLVLPQAYLYGRQTSYSSYAHLTFLFG